MNALCFPPRLTLGLLLLAVVPAAAPAPTGEPTNAAEAAAKKAAEDQANDVHFSEAGYEYFGARVAAEISAALPGPRGK
jgi:lysophospholipase L1-like esterase